MKEKKGTGSGIYIIAITAFFLGCFLMLVLFGTNIYRNIAGRQAVNNSHRAVLSYLLTVTRMDETSIYSADDPEFGQMLVVEETGSGYANRIYVSEGYLVEDFGKTDSRLRPEYATPIGETDLFEIEEKDSDLLKINTDQGSVFIHINSRGEAAK